MKVSCSENTLSTSGNVRSRKCSSHTLDMPHIPMPASDTNLDQLISSKPKHTLNSLKKMKFKTSDQQVSPASTKNISRVVAPPVLPRSAYLLYYARLFCLFIVSIAVCQVGFMFYPFLSLLKPLYWRKFSDQLEAMWVNSCLWLFPTTYLVQHGDFPDSSTKPKIIICNHQTEVDWFYLWMVARLCKIDRTGSVKIMLKEEVGKIPIFGWGCRLFQFIFLKRSWKEDEKVIDSCLKRFCEDGEPLWIFLFPEGTTINTRCREKSKNYGRMSDRPRPDLDLTILPRARGFQAVLDMVSKYSGETPEVYDMTMSFDSYTGEVPTWEMGYGRNRDVLVPNHSTLVLGACSSRCHLDSRKFAVDEITSHPDGVEGWLDSRWVRKERLMEKFIHKQGFDNRECGKSAVTKVEGSLWKSVLVLAANAAMWIYLAIAIQHKTEGVSFLEMLPQYI